MRELTAPVEAYKRRVRNDPLWRMYESLRRQCSAHQSLIDHINATANIENRRTVALQHKRGPGRPSRREEIRQEYDALYEEDREGLNTDVTPFAELRRKIIARTGDRRGLGPDAMRAALRRRALRAGSLRSARKAAF
jgi:hypothetical protein